MLNYVVGQEVKCVIKTFVGIDQDRKLPIEQVLHTKFFVHYLKCVVLMLIEGVYFFGELE